MLFIIILLFAICEGSNIPIELKAEAPVSAEKLTYKTLSPTQLSPVHPKYFVYNILQVDPNRPIPLIHFPYGEPGSAYVASSFNYYGSPLYDYQIHYSPFIPNVPAMIPSYIPQQQPITPPPPPPPTSTTQRPFNDEDDNIEKLDDKLDPSLETGSNNDEFMHDDDSVVIEADD